ncbi:ATP-binding cassette domain-containing protein [Flavobacteriaceae bacterium]|jgi:cell division transport system ATP-binding protein|nr:ATP-binding cassette domain-containing protein [Flavobacteriaceae bacterium]MBT4313264.1 ATP-binding cassette domain-containing protein [Flavobacteriaceae bacterium]MBT5091275.1 ATP-binding cassette domain-containing protein [Flavobacteriaceae bacterium]MBT5284132.1 ATP-binding cassette domain-containing protein [Flavobacteriaceae bacterium]MBT5445788.1 ATP-binding cassette domain-containing protein [Flavobacteriaceae bacterium]|tara:strand:+ start:861 stop:1541 length:681 start_codon:yes stop_codon:yes gene_type:complete
MQNAIVTLDKATIINEKNVIFSDINFSVGAGEFVFLIGKTGSGKSSLLKVLYGDLQLSAGQGAIVGYNLTEIKENQIPLLRRKIGVVFQDFKLLPDRTIFDNLVFVLKATGWKNKEQIKTRVSEVLHLVNVPADTNKFPFELSGGEQQRVAIARALLNHPELIIADEPTGNLDPETSQEIMQLFRKLHAEGMSVIMATHDYNMIMKFPGKIFQCDKGNLNEVIAKK